jgi:co-chaperonin GroES (HSP10)
MKYIPLNDYVVIKKLALDTTTASGIILQTAQGADNAEVVAFAEDVKGIAIGDKLLIRWSNSLKVDGDIYAVSAKEIVCILQD